MIIRKRLRNVANEINEEGLKTKTRVYIINHRKHGGRQQGSSGFS